MEHLRLTAVLLGLDGGEELRLAGHGPLRVKAPVSSVGDILDRASGVSYLLPVQNKSLAETYSSKSDDELIALAGDAGALVDEARSVLADELRRRNVTVKLSAAERGTPRNNLLALKLLLLGTFVLNLVIAIFGTVIVESSILSTWSRIGRAHSVSGIEAREWFLSLTIAALLGIFIGKRWSRTAVWVWTLPVVFFVLGALAYKGPSSSVLVGGGFAEHFFAPNCLAHPHDCRDFFVFTIPAARAAAYSLAVWLSSHFRNPMA
jgi:hypothetical protein